MLSADWVWYGRNLEMPNQQQILDVGVATIHSSCHVLRYHATWSEVICMYSMSCDMVRGYMYVHVTWSEVICMYSMSCDMVRGYMYVHVTWSEVICMYSMSCDMVRGYMYVQYVM